MKINCIIVEDEKIAALYLQQCCKKMPEIEVANTFENAQDALAFLQENFVDLIFLDIEMPGLNGIQMLELLPYSPYVVITSSKKDYAFDAFEKKAVDYLKKPFSFPRFEECISKITKLQQENTGNDDKNDFFIKTDGKLVKLSIEDILFVQAVGDYVSFVTADTKYLVLSTLKNIEQKLSKKDFLKVHRSYLVNVKKIKDIEDCSLLIEKHLIPIGRTNKSLVMKKLNIL